jgi:hypothetical protein
LRTAYLTKRETILLIALLALGLLLLAGCGQKGKPTMKSFAKPSPVTDMTAYHGDGKIVVSWTYTRQEKVTIKGFYVERAEGNGPFETLTFLNADTTEFTDKSFVEGKNYRYRIRVYSLRNVISDGSKELKVDPVSPPSPPGNLRYHLTNDAVEVTWDGEGDGITYDIYRGADKESCNSARLNTKPLEKPFFKDGVDAARKVFYSVRSAIHTSIINESMPSECLEIDPGSFIPARPTDLRVVQADDKIYLSWKENPETWIRGYRIYRIELGGRFVPVADVVVPMFLDEGPAAVRTSYYVTALGPVKESSPSGSVSVGP